MLKKYLPTKLKWLQYLPIIMLDKMLEFLKEEKRGWVIILAFVLALTVLFRGEISAYIANLDPIQEQAETSVKVNEELQTILDSTGAERIYIFQFHNGVSFYTGEHAQRFSCTYEIVQPGYSREAGNLQDMYVSVYSWWIKESLDGMMEYHDVSKIKNYTTRAMLEEQGVTSVYSVPIIYKSKIVGLVRLDFVGEANVKEEWYKQKDWFHYEINKISEYLGA